MGAAVSRVEGEARQQSEEVGAEAEAPAVERTPGVAYMLGGRVSYRGLRTTGRLACVGGEGELGRKRVRGLRMKGRGLPVYSHGGVHVVVDHDPEDQEAAEATGEV